MKQPLEDNAPLPPGPLDPAPIASAKNAALNRGPLTEPDEVEVIFMETMREMGWHDMPEDALAQCHRAIPAPVRS